MSDEPKERVTILAVTAENFRRLRACEIRNIPKTGLVKVTGDNAAGKTTVLRTILEGLGGRRGILAESVVNDAAVDGRGWLRLDLTNGFTVERVYSGPTDKGTLHVVGPDGGTHGQTKLSDWIGPYSFDPLALFDKSEAEIADLVLSVAGDPTLKDRLAELRTRRAALEEERRPHNSTVQRIQRMTPPTGTRPEKVSFADALTEQARLRKLADGRRDALAAADHIEGAADRAARNVAVAEDDVAAARDALEAARVALGEAEENLTRRRHAHGSAVAAAEEARANAEALPDPAEDLAAVEARLADFQALQDALEPWKAWDRAQAERAEAQEASDALTERIRALAAEETALVAAADIPVEGVTFTDDGLRLNGRGLKAASGGERLRMAANLAMAVNSEVGVCLIDEANDVGMSYLEELDEVAVARGFQTWVCRLGLEGPGEVVVQDGVAYDAATAAEKAGGAS